MILDFLVYFRVVLQSQSEHNCFGGVMDIPTRYENDEHEQILNFWKATVKSYEFSMKQNNYTELWVLPEFKICVTIRVKMDWRTPSDPKSDFCSIQPLWTLIEPLQSP